MNTVRQQNPSNPGPHRSLWRRGTVAPAERRRAQLGWLSFVVLCALATTGPGRAEVSARTGAPVAGLSYTNEALPRGPWSAHVVRFDRTDPAFAVHSAHALRRSIGLSTLTEQVAKLDSQLGLPVAAINGDFYQRVRAYVGDPRGLQIVNGEVISAPDGGATFWIDAAGEPHLADVAPQFEVIWPSGNRSPIGLDGERPRDGLQLYTPRLGPSTCTVRGREFVLEPTPGSPWLPLRLAQTYRARVREVREAGDTPLTPGILVLSVGPLLARTLPPVPVGTEMGLRLDSTPSLAGAITGLAGGPVLVRGGRRQRIVPPPVEEYEFTTMRERHPRSAIGWNQRHFFLVEVDGRLKGLSVGMTLDELAAYLVQLGCREAINLDGGGSATLWFEGQVRNQPCDGRERPIANSLIVVRRRAP